MRDRTVPDQTPNSERKTDSENQQTTPRGDASIQNENTPEKRGLPNNEIEISNKTRSPPNITEDASYMNNLGKQSIRQKNNLSKSKKDSYSLSKWKFGDNINKTINKAQIPNPPDWEAIDSFETVGKIKRDADDVRYRRRRRNIIFIMIGLFLVVAIIACAVGVALDFHFGRQKQMTNDQDDSENPIIGGGNGNQYPPITDAGINSGGQNTEGNNHGGFEIQTTQGTPQGADIGSSTVQRSTLNSSTVPKSTSQTAVESTSVEGRTTPS
ncbi:uncharacterized protein [Ptychodera flava]